MVRRGSIQTRDDRPNKVHRPSVSVRSLIERLLQSFSKHVNGVGMCVVQREYRERIRHLIKDCFPAMILWRLVSSALAAKEVP